MKTLNGSYSQQFSKKKLKKIKNTPPLKFILLPKHIIDLFEISKYVSCWYQNSEAFDTFPIIWAILKFYEISSI